MKKGKQMTSEFERKLQEFRDGTKFATPVVKGKKYLDYDDPKLRNAFCRDLAKIVAKQMARVAPGTRESLLMILQDSTSLYSPFTSDLTQVEIRKLAK